MCSPAALLQAVLNASDEARDGQQSQHAEEDFHPLLHACPSFPHRLCMHIGGAFFCLEPASCYGFAVSAT